MVVINPGSGPVEGGTVEHAQANILRFIEDLDRIWGVREVAWVRCEDFDAQGRYGFRLVKTPHETMVEMPGWELDRVRFLGDPQNIWHFPRLFIDGDSWVWKWALSCSARRLLGDKE